MFSFSSLTENLYIIHTSRRRKIHQNEITYYLTDSTGLYMYVYTGPFFGIFIGHLFSVGWIQHIFLERALTHISFITPLHQHPTILFCKAKKQYLLPCEIIRYCLLALHGRKLPENTRH